MPRGLQGLSGQYLVWEPGRSRKEISLACPVMTNSTAQLMLWCRAEYQLTHLFGSILISWGREVGSSKHFLVTQHVLKPWEQRQGRGHGLWMKKLWDWPLHSSEGSEGCCMEMDQGHPIGLHPNTDLPIGRHSSKVYLWDRKDTKFKTISLALPQLLLRTRIIIIMAHICGTFTVYLVRCYTCDLTDRIWIPECDSLGL